MAGRQPEYCGNCGAKLKPESIYCIRCGQKLEDFAPPTLSRLRPPIVWVATLIVVCAVAGIALGAGLAQFEATGRIVGLGFLRRPPASPPATVAVTPTLMVKLTASPTVLVTATPTLIATHTPIPTPTATATVIRTATPTATYTPTPTWTPTPRPSATEACTLAAGPTFAPLWTGVVRNSIGCPTSQERGVFTAYQEFDGGFMVWRQDRADIVYVFYNDGTYGEFIPTWQDGTPEYSCPDTNTPSTSPPTPRRGFGSVWCNYPVVRQRLGWADTDEIGDWRNLQDFQRGLMLQRAARAGEPRYVAYSDTHTWERY